MSKRIFLLLIMLIVTALVLAACGGGGAQPEAAPAEEQAPAEEPAVEQAPAEEEAMEEAPAEEEAMEEEAMMEEDPLGSVVVAPGDPIRIASVLVIAGPNATLGIDSQTGVEVAIRERGDVAGHPVELVAEDGGCSAEGGQTAATKVASDDSIVAVVGHNCSSSCTPAAPIYADAGMTMISPSCTAPTLTGEGTHVESLLRTAHNDNVQGRVMAEFVFNELGLRSAATIHDGSPYAEQLQQVFANTFVDLGGTITAQEAVNVGDTDMRPVLTSIAVDEPEIIYYPIFIAEGGFVTAQAKEIAGLENTVLAGADGMISPAFIEAAGEASEGMYISGPDLSFSGAMYDAFLADYIDILGEEPLSAFHAHAFDATNMIFDAIEQVAQTDADGNTVIGRQALRDALYATSGLEGITGNLSCNELGDCADPKIAVNQIQGGEYVPIYQGGELVAEAMAEEGGEEMEAMALAPAGLTEVDGLLVQSAGDCAYGGKIGQIKAVDEMTVEFTMCRPDPAFIAKAAFVPFYIQPREWIEETGGAGEMLEHPIGTGPYMLDSWNRGDSIIFKRFDDYWGDPPIADTLVFRWSSEAAARLLELQAGTVDQITNIGSDDYATVENDPNLQLLPRPNPNILYLALNNKFEPMDDVRVRQAIAMGIDRQRIVDNFYPEGSTVASHFTPCSIPNGCQGEPWYDFDPEAARELLAEAGYPDGYKTSIFYRDVVRVYLPEAPLVAVEFQNQLKENLNIDAEVVVMESGEFIDKSTAGELDGLYLLGWGADYLHVTNFLDFHFSGSNPQFGDPYPEIYEVLEEASTIADEDVTAPLYEQANNAIRELVPMVPIAHGAPADAARADVVNAHAAVLGPPDFWDEDPGGRDTLVWMKNAEPIGLWCADQTDGESLDACTMVTEGLYQYDKDGAANPTLATSCEANEDSTVWTCFLREGVKFHDGSDLDANDVVMSWAAGIDAANPYHVGSTGAFEYFSYLWDDLMNAE
jgi:peptide/nickel transport system substrate-binding protein